MLWVAFEKSEFFFSMICYIGSGTFEKIKLSDSNPSSTYVPRLTKHYLFTGFTSSGA